MDLFTNSSMLMMEKSLDYLWTKQSAVLDNIANVETPGYKSKYVTFEDALNNAILSSTDERGITKNAQRAIESADIQVHTNENESTRLDGNSVNITEQNVELTRNAYQMQFVMDSISTDISIIRSAIGGA